MKKETLLYLIVLLSVTYSCIPAKKVKYLQTIENEKAVKTYTTENTAYKLQLGDNIYIDLSSIDPETELILSPNQGRVTNQGPGAKYKNVYLIDNNGFINLPHIGLTNVKGYTLTQVADSVSKKLNTYFNQINIQVRLADGFITVLGEVKSPGRYQLNYNNKISVYELIGLAGDLTTHANRSEIKIVRRTNNESVVFKIDLTQETILENEYYYLQPNDIIYVEPLRAVFWDSKSFPFMTTLSIILATATSVLVIFTYLK